MSNPFANTDFSQMSKLKIAGILLGGLLAVAIILTLLKAVLFSVSDFGVGGRSNLSFNSKGLSTSERISMTDGLEAPGVAYDVQTSNSMPPYESDYATGNDAEKFEALSYDVAFKNSSIEDICDAVETWKPLNYVVFENAVRNDSSCSYRFKVERTYVSSILSEIEKLDPEEFTANTETMKKQLVEYSDQLSILLRKQEILEKTLEEATTAYSDVMLLAKQVEDVDALARIIKNKTNDITLLTNERIMLAQQIESLSRRSGELEDRIEYVYFSLHAQQYEMFAFEAIKESWVAQVRQFVYEANTTLQNLTLGIAMLFLTLLQTMLYIIIVGIVVLVVAKYGWHYVKEFWKGGRKEEV